MWLFFALLGLPVYVCAAGATPLVAVFLLSGVSPGAALAFLMTGPATNVSTFGVLSQLHGKKLAAVFGLLTMAIAILCGVMTNHLFSADTLSIPDSIHQEENSIIEFFSLGLLISAFLFSISKQGARQFINQLGLPNHDHDHDHDHGHNHGHQH